MLRRKGAACRWRSRSAPGRHPTVMSRGCQPRSPHSEACWPTASAARSDRRAGRAWPYPDQRDRKVQRQMILPSAASATSSSASSASSPEGSPETISPPFSSSAQGQGGALISPQPRPDDPETARFSVGTAFIGAPRNRLGRFEASGMGKAGHRNRCFPVRHAFRTPRQGSA